MIEDNAGGRGHAGQRRWEAAYDRLSAMDRQSPLEPPDLERLAIAAYLIGRDADALDVLTRAHNAFLTRGEPTSAARSAFWSAFMLMNRGDRARAGGWLARAHRLLDGQGECVERGYLLLPVALQQIGGGDLAAAAATFADAADVGGRFGDPDLLNLARQGRGRTLIGLGEVAQGVALLDEVMVAVTSGELSPIAAGTIYCSVISACFDLFDVRRAQEWTDALDHWCATQPDLVPYRGECLVHRAEILLLHGVWAEAIAEAERARERLGEPAGQPSLGAAFYQLGELHRLRGEFIEAEDAYRLAGEAGRMPQPGLALLRLAQGRVEDAKAAVSRVLGETRDRRMRCRALAACVDISLAATDVPAARAAAGELSAIARALGTPFLRAVAAHASGAVSLAEGNAALALASLREAWTIWRDLEAPYEAARATVLIGLACRQLGDADGGQMELNAAVRTFRQLGAAPDVARVEKLQSAPASDAHGALTTREVEVLKLVASGRTNRSIASALKISEKTVARHVSNIFTKLDVSSRAAATAYAFTHGVV